MSDAKKILRKIAANIYDDHAAGGHQFDLDLVRDRVGAEAANASLGDQLLEMAVNDAVTYVDDNRRTRPEQAEMFGDFDRVLAIGDGRRRRKGSCDRADLAAHIAIVSANVAAVTAAAAKEQSEYAQLLPYLTDGTTYEEAVAAWRAEHPEVEA